MKVGIKVDPKDTRVLLQGNDSSFDGDLRMGVCLAGLVRSKQGDARLPRSDREQLRLRPVNHLVKVFLKTALDFVYIYRRPTEIKVVRIGRLGDRAVADIEVKEYRS